MLMNHSLKLFQGRCWYVCGNVIDRKSNGKTRGQEEAHVKVAVSRTKKSARSIWDSRREKTERSPTRPSNRARRWEFDSSAVTSGDGCRDEGAGSAPGAKPRLRRRRERAPDALRSPSARIARTHQVQHGVDDFPIGHLSHLDQADQHGELEAVVHRHRHHLLGPLDVTERRALEVRHRDGV